MKFPLLFLPLIIVFLFLFFINKNEKPYQLDPQKFDSEQLEKLEILHDTAKPIFAQFVEEVEQKTGWKVWITSSYRTFAHQQRLKQENPKNATPGLSWHNYGFAIDINLKKDGQQIRKASSRREWEATGIKQIAEKYNLFWGIDIVGYHDPVHFDVSRIIKSRYNLKTADLQALAKKQFGSEWDRIEGNKIKI